MEWVWTVLLVALVGVAGFLLFKLYKQNVGGAQKPPTEAELSAALGDTSADAEKDRIEKLTFDFNADREVYSKIKEEHKTGCEQPVCSPRSPRVLDQQTCHRSAAAACAQSRGERIHDREGAARHRQLTQMCADFLALISFTRNSNSWLCA
mgnify:CR=1 FL=1